LTQQPKSLGSYVNIESGETCKVAARTVEACYEASFNRVNADEKDDRNLGRGDFGSLR
jgi:hypothetical protein